MTDLTTNSRLINLEAAVLKQTECIGDLKKDIATSSAYLKVLGGAAAILATTLTTALLYIIFK